MTRPTKFTNVNSVEGYQVDGTTFINENGGVNRPVETLVATNTLTAADSGKVLVLAHATEFATTLPAVGAGLNFKFVIGAAPSGANYTVVTPGAVDLIHGMVVSAADAGGSADSTAGTAADTITFVAGQAAVGDFVEVVSDGTSWFAYGCSGDEDAITYTAG